MSMQQVLSQCLSIKEYLGEDLRRRELVTHGNYLQAVRRVLCGLCRPFSEIFIAPSFLPGLGKRERERIPTVTQKVSIGHSAQPENPAETAGLGAKIEPSLGNSGTTRGKNCGLPYAVECAQFKAATESGRASALH